MTRHPHRSFRRIAPFALALAVSFGAPWSAAENTDRQQPINYSSDTGDVNYLTKVGSLAGNVVITQGALDPRRSHRVRQNPDNSMSATAYGNPVSFRQKHDARLSGGLRQAGQGPDGSKQLLELFDQGTAGAGPGRGPGEHLVQLGDQQFKAEGRDKGTPQAPGATADTRVRGVFQPKSDTPLTGKGKEPAPGTDKAPARPLPLKPAGEMTTPTTK